MEFNKDDVATIARAIVEDEMDFDNSDTSDYGWSCHYCCAGDPGGGGMDGGMEEARNTVKHKTDCPVLVARDVLTGAI